MNKTSIAIYCVNYHTYDSLDNYLTSIDRAAETVVETAEITVLVADNTVPTKPVSYHPHHFKLHQLATGDNKGYFGAVSHAMQQVSPYAFDYSVISNVDVLLSETFFTALVSYPADSQTGWIAPAIYSESLHFDFNPQALSRYSLRKMQLLKWMFKYPLLLKLKQLLMHRYKDVKACPSGIIYAGHGSFIILTKTFFQRGGSIDYPMFLYGEEIYLAEECRQRQVRVVYVPEISVRDIGKVSTGKFSSRQYCQYNYQAISYLINRFYACAKR